MTPRALEGLRVCDLSGQLAGAGATRFLASMGAQVIRVEDPVRKGRWDIMRGSGPFVDDRRGLELGGSFNNHNTEKLGVTINLRTEKGRELLERLIVSSDLVTENFAVGVLTRLGFPYERLKELREDIIYVSTTGFGYTGPYQTFKSWGPVAQAISGLTFSSGMPERPSAGWGYSYIDHQGANFMAIAILGALLHRHRTGEGQWVDVACAEVGAALIGPTLLDFTVNGRGLARSGMPDSNHSQSPLMVPHYIYPTSGTDEWVAIACRDDADWIQLRSVVNEDWVHEAVLEEVEERRKRQDELDSRLAAWTSTQDRFELAATLQSAGVPAAAVQRPSERIDHDASTAAWGLWPTVTHPEIGEVRVDGIPLQFSETEWRIERGAPLLGQHNDFVFGDLLGMSSDELDELRAEGVI